MRWSVGVRALRIERRRGERTCCGARRAARGATAAAFRWRRTRTRTRATAPLHVAGWRSIITCTMLHGCCVFDRGWIARTRAGPSCFCCSLRVSHAPWLDECRQPEFGPGAPAVDVLHASDCVGVVSVGGRQLPAKLGRCFYERNTTLLSLLPAAPRPVWSRSARPTPPSPLLLLIHCVATYRQVDAQTLIQRRWRPKVHHHPDHHLSPSEARESPLCCLPFAYSRCIARGCRVQRV